MEFDILPTLNKDYILKKITQEQIFEYYLGIKVEIGIVVKTPSAIRTGDNNPTFSFYYSVNGKLRAQDFAGYFHGDCFDVVAYVLHIDSRDKKSFMVLLDKIARDFRLHKYADKNYIETGNTVDIREVSKIKHKTIIKFSPRAWNIIDRDFWWAGNINRTILETGRVYPCQYVWINSQLNYTFVPKDPAYAYYFNNNDIKIYFPFRSSYRFLSNTSYLQGIDLIKPANFGVITKSYKDVLSLSSFGIQGVAPSAETVLITKDQWEQMKEKIPIWYSLMDFDRTGILMAIKLRKKYGIKPLFFSRYSPLNKSLQDGKKGAFLGAKLANNFNNYATVKDFYDFVKAFGDLKTIELIETVKNLKSLC